ncbi:MAG: Flp family type IVb pilin [Firmicutes bacterium]|jgi:pilus assembly protein Flp/PilA|nr:Flp family type IVb pilin [Bacillota bacterium]
MLKMISRLVKDEEGQGLAEYALILVLIAVAVVGVLSALGGGISGVFENITEKLGGAGASEE